MRPAPPCRPRRQPDIQQDQLEIRARKRRQARLAALHGLRVVAFILQHAAQGLADARLVVTTRMRRCFIPGPRPDAPLVSAGSGSMERGISTVKPRTAGRLSSPGWLPPV